MFDIANRTEADRVLNCVTLSFITEPLARWIYPEPSAFLTHLPRVIDFIGGGAFENGSAYRNDGFSAAALWLPPEVSPDEERLMAFLEETVSPDKHKAMFATFDQMGKAHPEEPCWHLAFIGVDPALQGKGLGAALLTASLKRCDDDGLPAYLESTNPANQSLYRRFGFEQIGLIEIDHAPPVFTMLRRPAKAATSGRG
jgi:ribosomal protein S18 acetylase RimI-like enzyme